MAGGAGGVSLRAVRQEHTNVAKDRRGAVVPEVLIKLIEGNLIMIMLPCVVSTVRIESTEALTVFFLVTKKKITGGILSACCKRSYLDDVHDKIQLVVSIIFAFFDFAAQTAWATAEARSQ